MDFEKLVKWIKGVGKVVEATITLTKVIIKLLLEVATAAVIIKMIIDTFH